MQGGTEGAWWVEASDYEAKLRAQPERRQAVLGGWRLKGARRQPGKNSVTDRKRPELNNCGAGKVGALDLPLGAMGYLWIGLGSALGGMARYGCSVLALRFFGAAFPWGTLFVNVSGSLVIGFLAALAIADGRPLISPEARLFLLVGVCGGFTTFSAFSLETLELARNGEWLWASAYVALSVTLCLLAVWLGYIGASALGR